MDKKAKDPLVALLLSFIFPGLGEFYAGKKVVGVGLSLVMVILGAGTVFYVFHPATKISLFGLVPLVFFFCLFFFSLLDAYLSAGRFNLTHGLPVISSIFMRAVIVVGFAGIVFLYFSAAKFVLSHVCFSFTTPPYCMEPSIYPGERVFVDRMAYRSAQPRRGDVVVYRYPLDPAKYYMHRIVAFPGETVELKDHMIFINAKKLADAWSIKVRHYNGGKLARRGMKPVLVPAGHYYVLGDNAARSEDSRAWGFLPGQNIVGKAYKIYYPFTRSKPVE